MGQKSRSGGCRTWARRAPSSRRLDHGGGTPAVLQSGRSPFPDAGALNGSGTNTRHVFGTWHRRSRRRCHAPGQSHPVGRVFSRWIVGLLSCANSDIALTTSGQNPGCRQSWIQAERAVFHPSGRYIFSESMGGDVHIWETATGKRVGGPIPPGPPGRRGLQQRWVHAGRGRESCPQPLAAQFAAVNAALCPCPKRFVRSPPSRRQTF